MPLPEDGVNVGVVDEEHGVVGGRAGEWEVGGVCEPAGTVPVTVVVEVGGVVDTEGLGGSDTVEDLLEVPEGVGCEGLLELLGTHPLTESGLGTTDGGRGILPESEVTGEVVWLGEVDLQVGKSAIVDFEAGGACHGLVRYRSVGSESDFGICREDGRGKGVLPVHGVVPVREWATVAADFLEGDFAKPNEPTVPWRERSGRMECEPVILVNIGKGVIHLVGDGGNAKVRFGLEALCGGNVALLLSLGESPPLLTNSEGTATGSALLEGSIVVAQKTTATEVL